MATTEKIRKGKFVVLASAVTLKTGPKPTDSQRFVRGQQVELTTEYTDVDKLIALGAIKKAVKGQTYEVLTAERARQNAGDAVADPAEAPVADIEPLIPEGDVTTAATGTGAASPADVDDVEDLTEELDDDEIDADLSDPGDDVSPADDDEDQ